MKYFSDVIIKELKLILKNKYYIFLIFLWPVIDCLFLGGIYFFGNVKNMPIAVIDEDNTKISRTITRYFNSSYAFDVKYRLNNVEELKSLMIYDKVFMGIYIPKDTQKNIKKFLPATVTSFINGANYLTANLSEIEGANIIATINAGLKNTMMKKKGIQKNQAEALMLPIRNDTSKLFNPTYHYGFFLTPGIWISVLGQLLLILGTLSVGREIEIKNFKIQNVFSYLFAKIFLYTIISIGYFEVLFRVFFPLFDIPFDGSAFGAVILSVLFSMATLILGMVFATTTGNRIDALKGCLLVGAPAFLLSGYTWPLEQMPPLMRTIAHFIPLTSYLEGFRKIFQQNMTIEYILPFAKTLGTLIILYFVVAYAELFIRNRYNKLTKQKK